jgi:hypothetical protein
VTSSASGDRVTDEPTAPAAAIPASPVEQVRITPTAVVAWSRLTGWFERTGKALRESF